MNVHYTTAYVNIGRGDRDDTYYTTSIERLKKVLPNLKVFSEICTWPYINEIENIISRPEWYNQSEWMKNSVISNKYYISFTFAKLEYLLKSIEENPDSQYYYWVDAGIFSSFGDCVLSNLPSSDDFFLSSFPYQGNEVHGLDLKVMRKLGYTNDRVCRATVMGGTADGIKNIYKKFFEIVEECIRETSIGTEEAIFSILACRYPALLRVYEMPTGDVKNFLRPSLTFTMTTCKRLGSFIRTMDALLEYCLDFRVRPDRILIVDDSSPEDERKEMKKRYPFIDLITHEQKSHAHSLNVIRRNLNTEYVIMFEDDWLCENYFKLNDILKMMAENNIDNLRLNDYSYPRELKNNISKSTYCYKYIHSEYKKWIQEKGYEIVQGHDEGAGWPGFSLNPICMKTCVLDEDFDESIPSGMFEFDWSYRHVTKTWYMTNLFTINHIPDQVSSYVLNGTNRWWDEKSKKFAIWIETSWAFGRIAQALHKYANVDIYDWHDQDQTNELLEPGEKWRDYDKIISTTIIFGMEFSKEFYEKLIVTAHCPSFDDEHFVERIVIKEGVTYCGVSQQVCENLKNSGCEKVVWTPFGADTDLFSLKYEAGRKIKRIGLIAGITNPGHPYTIIKRFDMFKEICENGGFEPVYINGRTNENMFDDIELLISCSVFEGGPLGIFEASSSGIPVMTTKTGNAQEIEGIVTFTTAQEAIDQINIWNQNLEELKNYTERVTQEVRENWSMKALIAKHMIPIIS